MVAILTSGVGTFARLVDEGQVGRVTLAVERAIEKSFELHPIRHFTTAEVQRRFDMVAAIFVKLRADLKWGIERACSHLSEYLNAELSGAPWTPDDRTCWMPEDGSFGGQESITSRQGPEALRHRQSKGG